MSRENEIMKQGPETGSCTNKESNDASNDATFFFFHFAILIPPGGKKVAGDR
jgi:hypothetical protein